MEKELIIKYELRDDGRLYLSFSQPSGQTTNLNETLAVLVSSLSMTIRVAGTEENISEGKLFNDVIETLKREFINSDSFKDLKVSRTNGL